MNTILNSVYTADAYFRLSKEDGDKAESDSIVNQKAFVREFLRVHPEIQIYSEKVDDGYTGVSFERPAFQEMLEDIRAGKVNCVIVKDLSRFGRNYIEAGRYIEKIFPYLGVRFIAINDNIDTAAEMSAADEMLIPFKNLINDAYCRDISVKVRSHLDAKRENGQCIGSFAPYGYKKSPCNKNQLLVDEKAASMVRQIFKWKIEGMSAARIADKLNGLGIPTPMEYKRMNGENYQCHFRKKGDAAWTTSSVRRILCNETYTGMLVQGKTYSPSYKVRKRIPRAEKDWVRCENCHEAIVSAEDFELVRKSFGQDTRVAPDRQALYLFSGIAKCGYCKGNMTRRTVPAKGKKYIYLACVENKNSNGCSFKKMVSLNKFEETILSIINLHIESIFEMSGMLEMTRQIPYSGYLSEKLQENIAYKESLIEKKKRYAADIYGDYKDGMITSEEYQELRISFRRQTESLEEEVRSLKQELEKIAKERDDKVHWAARFLKYRGFQQLTREILLNLVEEIRVFDKDRIEVVFKYQDEYEEACRYIQKEEQAREVKTDGEKE